MSMRRDSGLGLMHRCVNECPLITLNLMPQEALHVVAVLLTMAMTLFAMKLTAEKHWPLPTFDWRGLVGFQKISMTNQNEGFLNQSIPILHKAFLFSGMENRSKGYFLLPLCGFKVVVVVELGLAPHIFFPPHFQTFEVSIHVCTLP
jgi:hypothetical protein